MAGSMRLVRGTDVWELRVYLGRDSTGRVRQRSQRFQGTKRAAERELARLVIAQEDQPAVVPEAPVQWGPNTTINDALEAWRSNGWDDLSPKTSRRYESAWDVHIRASFGRRRIASIGPYDVERYFRALKAAGLSEGSVRMIRSVLHRACRLARRWSGNVLPNPIADTELPRWDMADRAEPVRAPSVDEVLALIATARSRDERLGVFLRVLAATGMRRGEAAALRWSDLDSEAGTLRVDKAVVAARGGAELRSPKTRASMRTLAVDDDTLAELADLRERQAGLATSCGLELAPDGFVFSYEPGGSDPPHPDTFSHGLARTRSKAGVASDVHLHSLRHFHATVVDSVISDAQKQARLGWSTVQMARHYTDAVPAEDRRAAEHVARLLAGAAVPSGAE